MPKNIPQMEPWFDETEGQALYDYFKNNRWTEPWSVKFEKKITDFTGASFAICSSNGTLTLTLALLALNLKPGDEVLIPNSTMIATPNSCLLIGVKPIFVDIEAETLCLDLKKAKEALTPKTKAMMYVPLNGRCGNMDEVIKFCKENNIYLIEDAAQAFGSYWKGNHWFKKHLGTFGDIGSFSFSLFKIITTGQGGALVTNSKEFYQKIKLIRDFGRISGPDTHDYLGWNFKMSNILALTGVEQFKKLSWRINRKKEIYKRYFDALSGIPDVQFIKTDLELTTPWFIDIFVPNPKALAEFLKKEGIGTRFFYPPIHAQKIYKDEYIGKNFPISEYYSSRGLWLPSSSQLKDEEIDYITNAIKKFFKI